MSEYIDIKNKTYKIIQRTRKDDKTDSEVESERETEKKIVEELYKIFLVEAKA